MSVVLDTLRKRITISNNIFKFHLADNGAQVALKRIANLIGDFVDVLVEEVTRSGLKKLRGLGCNANLNGCIRLHVNKVVCGYIIRCFYIHRNHGGRHRVNALNQRHFKAGLTMDDALSPRT